MAAVPAAAAATFLKRHLASLKVVDREIIWLIIEQFAGYGNAHPKINHLAVNR
jgi:hypothetical protein